MPAIDQLWLFLTGAVLVGLVVGVILTRALSGRHAYHSEVRWRRRYSEAEAEHKLRIATLTKTLNHAREKQDTLRQALDESDETIRLLSADGASPFEQEIAERNLAIAELKKTVSHARAMVADATDHETTLQNQIEVLHCDLIQRDKDIENLTTRNAEYVSLQKDDHHHEQRYSKLQTELATTQQKLADRERELAELMKRLQDHELQLSDAQTEITEQDARIGTLGEQLKDMHTLLPRLNKSIAEHEAAMASVVAALSTERQKTQSLEQTLERKTAENQTGGTPATGAKVISIHKHLVTDDLIEPTEHFDKQQVHMLEAELLEWKRKFAAINNIREQDLADLPAALNNHGKGRSEILDSKDDLKLINGIGPVLETALNDLGFYQFEQIADMSQQQIEKMGRHDRTLPGRIRRYKWVEQAQKLREATYPDNQPGV